MEEKYQNKYRVSSPRLAGWDYGSHGLYFVTICTKDRIHYFGKIEETKGVYMLRDASVASLQMTDIGKIALDNWLKIPHYHSYVELDDFVIMPDHIHGIIFINKPNKISWEANKFGAQRNSLASIMRGYKSAVTKYANDNNIAFACQPRYYDRVIRNEKEYENIRGYIYDNPDNWLLNKDSLENLFTP